MPSELWGDLPAWVSEMMQKMALAPLLPLAHSQLTFKSIYYPYIIYCFVIVSLPFSVCSLYYDYATLFVHISLLHVFSTRDSAKTNNTTHTVTNFINKVLCFSTRFMCLQCLVLVTYWLEGLIWSFCCFPWSDLSFVGI